MTVKVDSCSESANCIFLWKLSPSPPRLLLSNATAPAPAYLLPCRVLFFSLSSYHYFVIVKLSETVKNYKILLRISINKLICFPHEITLYFDVMESLEELRSDHPIMESTKSEEETVNLEYFGRYLTNEYEILERTLSYLNINDLISASHVTSSWKQVCERLLEKRKNLRWHIRCKCGAFRGHNFKNKINFKSSLALGFQLTNSKDEILNDLMENESYLCRSSIADDLAKGSNIPGVQDANMFIIKSCKLEVPYYTEKNELKFLDNAEACLLFPELEGFQVHVETYSPSEECDKLFSYPSIKGILVLSSDGDLDSFEESFNDLLSRSTTSVAMAGGIFEMVTKFSKKRRIWKLEDNLVNVFFCGENITCYSNILIQKDKKYVENFMKNMKTEVGPFDSKKQRRIAIVSRCIARPNTKYEKSIFKQYFPDVPSFTLLANGECGYHSFTTTTHENSIKRKKHGNVSITYSYSVVYFFVTLNLSG